MEDKPEIFKCLAFYRDSVASKEATQITYMLRKISKNLLFPDLVFLRMHFVLRIKSKSDY